MKTLVLAAGCQCQGPDGAPAAVAGRLAKLLVQGDPTALIALLQP